MCPGALLVLVLVVDFRVLIRKGGANGLFRQHFRRAATKSRCHLARAAPFSPPLRRPCVDLAASLCIPCVILAPVLRSPPADAPRGLGVLPITVRCNDVNFVVRRNWVLLSRGGPSVDALPMGDQDGQIMITTPGMGDHEPRNPDHNAPDGDHDGAES